LLLFGELLPYNAVKGLIRALYKALKGLEGLIRPLRALYKALNGLIRAIVAFQGPQGPYQNHYKKPVFQNYNKPWVQNPIFSQEI
jgi:hypothetical protein